MAMRIKNRKGIEIGGEDLLDFARSYLSEAFPNPDRQGCPPEAALRSLAFNPTEAAPGVTEHLASCSPCFRRYGELLAESKSQKATEKRFTWDRISVWTKGRPLLAGAAVLCLVLIAIGVALLLRGIGQPNAPPIETNRKPGSTEPQNPTLTYVPFTLDLSALSPVRGSEPPTGSQRRIFVPNARLDLTVTLPLASPESGYDIKLMADGQTFWSKSAQSRLQKGKTLIQLEADFTKIQAGNYDLEVRSSNGIRLVQLVSIQRASGGSVGQNQ